MSRTQGQHLRIRAMVYVAGEPVPLFWPMRSFIANNPLHGLEHLPFAEAVERGVQLFHARGFLPRRTYQDYLQADAVDRATLSAEIERFVAARAPLVGIDLPHWLMTLLTRIDAPVMRRDVITDVAADVAADVNGVLAALAGNADRDAAPVDAASLIPDLRNRLLGDRPIYESIDALCGTTITAELNDLVIRACLDFFDEGQSVWVMPDRELGFFRAWRNVAGGPVRALLDEIEASEARAGQALSAEMVVDHIMRRLQVPEENWIGYFTREIAQLHGWAGFIRWRASARHYHWSERYRGDLVDLLAVRLTLALRLLNKRIGAGLPATSGDLQVLIEDAPKLVYLRHELYTGDVLPDMVQRVESALEGRGPATVDALFDDYTRAKRQVEAHAQRDRLHALAVQVGAELDALDRDTLSALLGTLTEFEQAEGMIWLRAMEDRAMQSLLTGLSLAPAPPREKRPFVQAAFCIDTRSERIRRHLEAVGDYQTFGIAGFFGVPVSLIELGKGSETHLCPVLLTPKNVVLEMSSAVRTEQPAVTSLGHAMHKLKESVLSPFVTVEAIGLLFGLDMIGKTVAPQLYNPWRGQLHAQKSGTHLLLDKLSREQADSILRAVQRAIIVEAAEQELGMEPEDVNDSLVRALREAALGHAELAAEVIGALGVSTARAVRFIDRLRDNYRINAAFMNRQMEELGRIGFSTDEQVGFVSQALSSIGLTRDFSRFVLLVGHGSCSENNPYESALDCGACGGNHGLVNARVLAQMANKPAVRRRLAEKGIVIPEDSWFLPAMHNTTTDEVTLHDLELLPTSHLVYLDRLRTGLTSAARLCAQERLPSLQGGGAGETASVDPAAAFRIARRNAMDWSQVRPEWGLSRNAYFIVGRRDLTRDMGLDGRAFLHSYDYRVDPKRRLLENILTGPLVVGQWINMQYYFSAVDNERFGSGSKVYHNVAGRFGVMTGNLSDLRTGLPAQTVLENGRPFHEPMRLITVIEAPFEHARAAIENVASVKKLVRNGWVRLLVIDPETATVCLYEEDGGWRRQPHGEFTDSDLSLRLCTA
ncbi:MAG: DUF2309 domain-containing protein [Gammaproteobacteria bacterium]|nr:DUF2309 domain-containing protein [Gammaproteobacteria bacterium]